MRLRKGLWLVQEQVEAGTCPDEKGDPEHDHEQVMDPNIELYEAQDEGNEKECSNKVIDFGDGHGVVIPLVWG